MYERRLRQLAYLVLAVVVTGLGIRTAELIRPVYTPHDVMIIEPVIQDAPEVVTAEQPAADPIVVQLQQQEQEMWQAPAEPWLSWPDSGVLLLVNHNLIDLDETAWHRQEKWLIRD